VPERKYYRNGGSSVKKFLHWLVVFSLVIAISSVFMTGGLVKAAEPAKEVRLTFIRAGLDADTAKCYQELIANYMKANPRTKIDYQQFNWGEEMETKLNVLYASGNPPDVVRYVISSIAQRASLHQYQPLDGFIKKWDDRNDFYDSIFDIGSYKGKTYGIPVSIEAQFLMYRKDHFTEVGLNPEKPPKTWDELLKYAEKLTKREGNTVVRAGFALPTSVGHHHLLTFARQNGAKVVDEKRDLPLFNDKKCVEALNYLVSFRQKNLIIPYIYTKDTSPFERGNASMYLGSITDYRRIINAHPEWKKVIGFGPPLKKVKQSSFAGAQIFFISSDSKYKAESENLIKFLLSKENLWKLIEKGACSPIRKSFREQFIQLNPDVNKVYVEAVACGAGMPKVTWAPLFEKYINIAYEETMYGKKNAKTALNDAVKHLKAEIKKQ
jgi:multiple sugar transport system substrate-binding protein